MAFYMKSVGGNVFKRVKTEAKRQELLAAGWTDADAPIEGEQDAPPEEETAAENTEQEGAAPPEEDAPAQGADAPIEATEGEQEAQQPDTATDAPPEEETAAENAEQESAASIEERPARNTSRRRASSKPKSETVTA